MPQPKSKLVFAVIILLLSICYLVVMIHGVEEMPKEMRALAWFFGIFMAIDGIDRYSTYMMARKGS